MPSIVYGTANLPKGRRARRAELQRRRDEAKSAAYKKTSGPGSSLGGLSGRAARSITGRKERIRKATD